MRSLTRSATLLVLCLYAFIQLASSQSPCEKYNENFTCSEGSPRRSFWIAEDPKPECGTNLVDTTIRLFAEGDEVIGEQFLEFGSRTEAVLMIGKTGTGKSTLTYFLAGNDSAMIAYDDGLTNIRITDCNGKIGGSVIVSQTTFPELVIDPKGTTAFFDYPGFFDTRAACVEIANAYFMLTVARRIPSAKIMIIVDYAAVNGDVKGSIKDTLVSVINFIPNIESYTGGIGLVATKVDKPRNDDTQLAAAIQKYIGQVKEEIDQTLTGDVLRKAKFIIDQLLVSGTVGSFRTPDDCGPLSDLPVMKSNKANLTKVIANLKYVKTHPNDFSMSLSSDAQIELANLATSLASNVTVSLGDFKTAITQGIAQQLSCPSLADCETTLSKVKSLYSNPIYVSGYENSAFWKDYTYSDMISNATTLFPTIFPDIVVDPTLLQVLKLNAGYLDFIQSLNASSVDVSGWMGPLKELKSETSKTFESKLTSIVKSGIESSIRSLFDELYTTIVNGFATLGDINEQLLKVDLLVEKFKIIKDNIEKSLTVGEGIRLSSFVTTTIANFQTLGLSPDSLLITLLKHELDFVYFLESDMGLGSIPSAERDNWLKYYTTFEGTLKSEQDWCNFVIAVFDDLADKKYQVDQKNLRTWWSGVKPFEYSNTSQADLTSLFNAFKAAGCRLIKTQPEMIDILMRDTGAKVETLNLLLGTSLENSLNCTGTGTDRTVCEGKFVSLQEVLGFTSKTQTKSIVIKSMHSVYIDNTLNGAEWNDGSNLNVIIISPTWVTTVNSIILNGRNGATQPDFESKGSSPGAAGGVGFNGGNFYGIGQNFIGDNGFEVQVSGGAGGKGQKGQDGNIGADGVVVEVPFDSSDKISETNCNAWEGGKVLLRCCNPHSCTPAHDDGGGACQADDDGAKFLVEGTPGSPGESGGAGGQAGLGGLGGAVFLKLVATNGNNDSVGSNGGIGGIGMGGTGGDGGKKGDTYEIWIDDAKGATGKWCKQRGHSIVPDPTRAGNGVDGGNGQSSITPNPQKPTDPKFEPTVEGAKYKGEFKTAATALKAANKFFKTPLQEFVDNMDKLTP